MLKWIVFKQRNTGYIEYVKSLFIKNIQTIYKKFDFFIK